jgi:hypothetical protein
LFYIGYRLWYQHSFGGEVLQQIPTIFSSTMTKATTDVLENMTAASAFWLIAGAAILTANPVSAVSFVGSHSCAECHERAYRDWSGSHHDLAMQEATKATVLGDFDDTTYTTHGVTSRFFENNGDYYVNTEGPDGNLQDYKIDFTFGVYPLQQYLIAFPGGRYQALGLAWDARPSKRGGQRWFHLYPDEHIGPGDILHWTQINQNWNYMCADCHSTNLRRNFDLESNRYETTWSEIDVSCEACHGPGSTHVAWARTANTADGSPPPSKDFEISFDERKDMQWTLDEGTVTAVRSVPSATFRAEIETCARCHSRRSPLGDAIDHGNPVLDSYRVALLTEDLYHADGQIKDEVYVYGSFLQSKTEAQSRGECPLHPVSSLRSLRYADPSLPHRRRSRQPVRRLPRPGNDVYGRRPTPRSQLPYSTAGSLGEAQSPERLLGLP